ncbi:MAG: hypothetical protein ACLUMK_01970 [Christensenellales bacterium]
MVEQPVPAGKLDEAAESGRSYRVRIDARKAEKRSAGMCRKASVALLDRKAGKSFAKSDFGRRKRHGCGANADKRSVYQYKAADGGNRLWKKLFSPPEEDNPPQMKEWLNFLILLFKSILLMSTASRPMAQNMESKQTTDYKRRCRD